MIKYLLIFYAGTFAGSFFYTLALRYAGGMFDSSPVAALISRSECPRCGSPVSVIGLIPVFGYFFLRGRCSACGEKISPVYPLWEVLYGALAVAVSVYHGTGLLSLNVFFLCAVCVCIAIVDIRIMIIPQSLVLLFLLLSLYPVVLNHNILDNVYGFFLLTLFFLLMLLIFPGAFGGGDVKLYAAAGFLFGVEMSIVLLEVSLISGALFGVAYAMARGRNFRLKIPFGPFIAAGIIITLLFGDTILLVYYRFMF